MEQHQQTADRRAITAAALLCLALLLLVAAGAPALAQPDGDLVVERFDAQLTVQPDGSVAVTEEIDVDFGADEHHGIERAIPTRYEIAEDDTQVEIPEGRTVEDYHRVLRIDDLAVSATAPDDVETRSEGGLLIVRIGDPDVTVTGTQTYRLSYGVEGALNAFDDRAELTWNVTGGEWNGPILAASATVEAPGIVDATCYEGPARSDEACTELDIGEEQVVAAAAELAPGEDLTVSVGVPLDAVAVPAPLLEERWRLSRALTGDPAAVPLTAASTVLAAAGVALLLRRGGREKGTAAAVAPTGGAVSAAPPRELRPAQLRLLVEGRVDDTALSATLFDLGARGHLDIEDLGAAEGEPGDGYRLRRTQQRAGDLLGYEVPLLEALFAEGETVRTDELGEDFAEAAKRFREAVEADGLARGWFPESPSKVRARRGGIAAGLAAVAAVLFGVALAFTEVALAVVPLLVAGGVAVVWLLRQPLRTPEGKRLAAQARAFERYLEGAAGADSGLEDEPAALFGRYLPYAIALGATSAWVAHFQHLPVAAETWAPAYFHSSPAVLANDSGGFTSSLSGLAGQVSTAPSGSTSSGGGSVGGGFGGGGGGGW